ncbi:hypothetical protein AAVH_23671 [Aphelenchoides avenae]|nr:hypothetical protein AAVH_23671 [Aphelenchus avenae]
MPTQELFGDKDYTGTAYVNKQLHENEPKYSTGSQEDEKASDLTGAIYPTQTSDGSLDATGIVAAFQACYKYGQANAAAFGGCLTIGWSPQQIYFSRLPMGATVLFYAHPPVWKGQFLCFEFLADGDVAMEVHYKAPLKFFDVHITVQCRQCFKTNHCISRPDHCHCKTPHCVHCCKWHHIQKCVRKLNGDQVFKIPPARRAMGTLHVFVGDHNITNFEHIIRPRDVTALKISGNVTGLPAMELLGFDASPGLN